MRVEEYRSGLRVLHIMLGGGRLEALRGNLGQAEQIARRNNCHRIQIEGRRGWMRALEGDWREVSRVIERDVTYGRRQRDDQFLE